MHLQLLYLTCRDSQEAQSISEALLEKQLIACANILPPVTSLYHWEGAIKQYQEVALLLKTRAEHFEAVESLIKVQHSYDCPCLLALDVAQGHAPFLEWIAEQTQLNDA